MADPTKYVRDYDFSDYQQSNPSDPLPGHELDAELDNLKRTTDETIDALSDIRRSDGKLQNDVVTADALADDAFDLFFEDLDRREVYTLSLVGDGVTTVVNLEAEPGANGALLIFFDGAAQHQSAYLLEGLVLTFTEPLPNGVDVEIRVIQYARGIRDAFNIHYDPQMYAGATSRTIGNKFAEMISVKDFGAEGDGTTDDTLAFQNAVATGEPVYVPAGTYRITDAVTLASGQVLHGAGRYKSKLLMDISFNLAALGVIVATNCVGGGVNGIGFTFDQPDDPANRAACYQYPPAIYLNGSTRWGIDDVNVSGGWDGIECAGNCAGLRVGFLEVGALSYGFYASGESLDFMHFETFHSWPFGFAGRPIYDNIYSDGTTVAFQANLIRGLDIKSLTVLRSKIVFTGGTYGQIANLQLENRYSTLRLAGGASNQIAVGSLSGSTSIADSTVVTVEAGATLTIGSGIMKPNASDAGTATPFINNSGNLYISNMVFTQGQPQQPIIYNTAGNIGLHNMLFNFGTNTARTAPFVHIAAGRASLIDLRFKDVGTGYGDAVVVASDDWHHVDVENTLGWGMSMPTVQTLGFYKVNGVMNAAATGASGFRNRLVNPLFQVDIEGNAAGVTADGAHVVEGWVTAFSNGVTTQTTSRVAGDSVPYALQYAVTTGSDAAIAAGDYATIDTAMEGFDVSDALWGTANAKSVWVAGRIMAPTTGVYCVAVSNADKSRSYVFEVSCTAGSYVDFEEEIPGDTSGTWGATTGIGAILRVCIAGGTTYQAAADAWQGGDFFATSNQANGLGANGNQLRIEALRYSVGAPMELEWRPYDIDLAKCKRYFVKGYGDTLRLFPIITGTSFQRRGNLFFPVEMRVPPAISNLLVSNIVSPSATNITTTHALITGASGADNECNIQGGGITMDARLI